MTEPPPLPGKAGGLTRRRRLVALILCGVIVAAGMFTVSSRRASANRRAADKAAQSTLSKAVAVTNAYFAENDRYTGFDTAVTAAGDPSIVWSMRPTSVSEVTIVGRAYALVVTTATPGDTIVLGVMSDSGTVFGLSKVGPGIPHECKGENFTGLTYAGCRGGW